MQNFEKVDLKQLTRCENSHVNALVSIASAVTTTKKRSIPVEFFYVKNIAIMEKVSSTIEHDPCWMNQNVQYILHGDLLAHMRAAKYCMVGDKLYRQSFFGPLLKCLKPKLTLKFMANIREGEFGITWWEGNGKASDNAKI